MEQTLRLLEIMARLRDPETGCPWDRAQSFSTIVPHTLEEAYEVADAIERGDMEDLRNELGDLLFQVVFYARLAEEQGLFDFEQIAAAISDKLVRRHPHVFDTATYDTRAAVNDAWEAHKARERQAKSEPGAQHSVLDGIALALPALGRAHKIQQRVARAGFDWPDVSGVFEKVAEELAEARVVIGSDESSARVEEEIGDLLFAAVNLARHAGADAEQALRSANARFERRFREIERRLAATPRALQDCSLAELDALWDQVKADE